MKQNKTKPVFLYLLHWQARSCYFKNWEFREVPLHQDYLSPTIIQFPDSRLPGELPLHICMVCYEPSVRGLLSCASLGQLLGDIMKTNKKSQSVAQRSIAQGPSLLYEWFTWWISTWHLVTTLHVAMLIPCQDKANELMHVDLRLFKRCSWSNSRHLCLPSFSPPFWVYLFLVCNPNLEEQELSLLAGRWPAILEIWQV